MPTIDHANELLAQMASQNSSLTPIECVGQLKGLRYCQTNDTARVGVEVNVHHQQETVGVNHADEFEEDAIDSACRDEREIS